MRVVYGLVLGKIVENFELYLEYSLFVVCVFPYNIVSIYSKIFKEFSTKRKFNLKFGF